MIRRPSLFAVSDRQRLGELSWERWCRVLRAAGVDTLLVRERDLDDRDLLELMHAARASFPAPGRLLGHRRFDLALAAEADGVHLPADGLPVAAVRGATSPSFVVGRSVHSLAEVDRARAEGADYVFFGPVFATPSKAGKIEPLGLDELAAACRRGLPVVAVGGVAPGNAAATLAAGASGVAAIRAFAHAESAREMAAAAGGSAR